MIKGCWILESCWHSSSGGRPAGMVAASVYNKWTWPWQITMKSDCQNNFVLSDRQLSLDEKKTLVVSSFSNNLTLSGKGKNLFSPKWMIIADLAFFGGKKTENQFSPRPGVKHFLFSKTFQDFSRLFKMFSRLFTL